MAGIISATLAVNQKRLSPLEYPSIAEDRFIDPLSAGIRAIHTEAPDCRYIIQIGDPGGHTQTSLFPQEEDGKSASCTVDFAYGYRNRTTAMTPKEIEEVIASFRRAARRVRQTGANGLEITASKGYLIHQFLNPATNRRTDRYGGSMWERFQLLREIVQGVRDEIGRDFLFGVRLSAYDYSYLPLRPVWPPSHYFRGNTLNETLEYGVELEKLGVDYLHIDSGFGFLHPKGNPGAYPLSGIQLFANSSRHLSAKAWLRAAFANVLLPAPIVSFLAGFGWKYVPAANAHFAQRFKQAVGLPIISNGGFQRRSVIEGKLDTHCDMVAIGRPLLANPDLLDQFREGRDEPENRCTWCNLCCTRTAVLPLGCYDIRRFKHFPHPQDAMEAQILRWSADPTP